MSSKAMSAHDAWQATVGQLELQLDRATYDNWLRGAELLAYEDGTFIISVRNVYIRDWLQKRLYSLIRRTLANIFGRTVEVRFVAYDPIEEEKDLGPLWQGNAAADEEQPPAVPAMPAVAPMIARLDTGLNPRYTFDRFVVGNSNQLANAAARSVVDRPGGAYNPLFIYGDVGLGKTHLLQAVGNACLELGMSVLYVSSEEFMNELVSAIRSQETATFRNRYRTLDVLMVDDIQFIAGKESTQEEFFHTFNALHGANSQIVLASDRRPRAMATLEERLRSRFEWGLITDIQPPDLEMRMAILREKSEQAGMPLPEDLAQFVAQKIRGNIRELEGALTQLIAQARLVRRPLSEALADDVLRDFRAPRKTQTVEAVLETVAEFHDLSVEELVGPRRTKAIALARQQAMYLARETTESSLPQIGEAIGGRDHTTIMHGYNKIADAVETDEEMRQEIRQLRMRLFEED